jgi:hypothetical protein
MADLPERLYRRGRPDDQEFEPTEELYHRCKEGSTYEDPAQPSAWRLKPSALRSPDFSVNRQKYSQPEDVLLPTYQGWGVAAFAVGDVPASISSPGQVGFEFRVEHVPEEENYAHSEIRTYRGERRILASSKVPDTVKSLFRQRLSERSRIIIHPAG